MAMCKAASRLVPGEQRLGRASGGQRPLPRGGANEDKLFQKNRENSHEDQEGRSFQAEGTS